MLKSKYLIFYDLEVVVLTQYIFNEKKLNYIQMEVNTGLIFVKWIIKNI